MKQLADRRTILLAAATAALARHAMADTTRSGDITITVGFEGGKFIPKGRLVIYFDEPSGRQRMAARMTVESDGKSKEISVILPLPHVMYMTSPRQIVAELQRPDGWLLARGSAQMEGGLPVEIILYAVIY